MAKKLFVLRLDSYTGDDTYLHCGPIETLGSLGFEEPSDEHHLYVIVALDDQMNAEIVDSGYRSLDEALHYWPEAGTMERINNGSRK